MSAASIALPAAAAPSERVVPSLAVQESWRLLRHPLMLAGFALFVLVVGQQLVNPGGARDAFATADSAMSFFPGIFAVIAANLVATRDHRAGSGEVLAALPARQVERTAALCLAALPPALLGLVLVLPMHLAFLALDRYPETPQLWHLVQGPVTLLGACLFGVMVARWAPFRGAIVVAFVALVALNVWVAGDRERMALGPMVSWPEWGTSPSQWAGLVPGSAAWHVVYLLGLCGLAATAALLRDAPRRRPLVLTGVALATLTVVAATWQLP